MLRKDDNDYERDLLARLKSDNAGRDISPLPECVWGHSMTPAPDEHPEKTDDGLRVLVIGSWTLGMLAFEAIKDLESEAPDKVNIVGLVTDDPLDPNARISKLKRFWRYYDEQRQEVYELDILEEALEFGVPCFTGEVKSRLFRSRLVQWKPDAIVVAGFGQRIDDTIIRFPRYGIYNVHPADLQQGHGAGPQPWEDLISRHATSMRVSIHKVSEVIDAGGVVGVSPPVNVTLSNGDCSGDTLLVGEKTFLPVKPMVRELACALCRNREAGHQGPLDRLDMEGCFSPSETEALLRPIDPARRGTLLPLSPGHGKDTV